MSKQGDREALYRPARGKRGAVLIGVLVFGLIIAMMLGATAWFVSSHYARAATDANYTHALYLAEAGINYEINQLSNTPLSVDEKYAVGGVVIPPVTYTIPLPPGTPGAQPQGQHMPSQFSMSPMTATNLAGQFTVTARVDNIYDPIDTTPDALPWFAPENAVIESTGTAAPNTPVAVSRSVRARMQRRGIFDDYTFFAINSATMNGSPGYVVGKCGTDCPWTANGHPTIIGTLVFNGVPTGTFGAGTVTGGVFYQPHPIIWPTVDQIADAAMSEKTSTVFTPGTGLAYIKANNDNALIQVFASGDASHVTTPPSDLTTSAGATTTSYDLSQLFGQTKDGNPGDSTGGNRFAFPTTTYTYTNPPNTTLTVSGYGVGGNRVVILPSTTGVTRDYYFENVSWTGAQALLVDNRFGPVRIWVGPAGSSNGADFSGTMLVASSNPSQFRIYDAQAGALNLGGGNVLPGGIYVWNGNNTGTVTVHGNPTILGSVICGNITISGNCTIITPAAGVNVNPYDYSLWYGFSAEFDETSPMAH